MFGVWLTIASIFAVHVVYELVKNEWMNEWIWQSDCKTYCEVAKRSCWFDADVQIPL